jgi:iron complex transport system substrate-binding protein
VLDDEKDASRNDLMKIVESRTTKFGCFSENRRFIPFLFISLYSEIRSMSRLIVFFIPLAVLFSCNRVPRKAPEGKTNLVTYAATLEIYRMDGYIQVRIFNPLTKKKSMYALSPTQPRVIQPDETWIKTPVKSMITLSGTHIGMLAVLNETDRIKGVANRNYIYSKAVLKGINTGKIIAFDNEESIPVESIIRSKAEMLVYSGFGSDFPHQEQLKRTGTLCIPNYDWKEVHPLGKAEWIKLFGYLTGREKEADTYFKKITGEYNKLKISAKKFGKHPTVFSGNAYGDSWYCPAGESYNAQLIRDAGGNYSYHETKGTGSLELSPEKVFSDNAKTDIWLNPGNASLNELKLSNPRTKLYKAYADQQIYCYSPNMNRFWEMSAIEPHVVLADLLAIFHPGTVKGKLYFYQKLK